MKKQSKGHSAKSTSQKVVNSVTTPNLQGQLFDEFGEAPLPAAPTPTEVNISISVEDSTDIETVIVSNIEEKSEEGAASNIKRSPI